MNNLKPGDRLHSFVVNSVHPLPEYTATGIVCTHEPTGCQVYHVHNDDPDKLFAFGFKTLPEDSRGVAHILEHTVLCGSQAFPVKDPFLLLLKGSMNTFMNAFTFPDKTLYPASSTVEKDLYNLMEVYGDAVFFPLLKPEMFRQEGHRLEFDAAGTLTRTGIVFNEMKGNYSTHDSVAGDWCMRSLFPDTAYGHDSGGDPAHIPELSYEQFVAFHRRYYHPSNTRIFLYGDLDTAKALDFLHQRFLSRFDRLDPPGQLADPAPFTQAIRLVKTYPAAEGDEEDGKASISINWLLGRVEDAENTLAMELLSEILLGSSASPLQRALVDSSLGEDLSSTTGLETELSRLTLSVGLRGTAPGKEAAIEQLIVKTLQKLVNQGLEPQLVEGTMRRFEFRSREIKGGGPFGLRLMRRAFRGWLHGAAPETTLVFAPLMQGIRERLQAEPRWFESLIQTNLLDNIHRSTVTIIPDSKQNEREHAAERTSLAAIQAGLSEADRQRLQREQAELEHYQSAVDDPAALAKIPFLAATDIPVEVRLIPAEGRAITLNGAVIPVQTHPIYTNGISYVDLCFDLEHLSAQELSWMTLYATMVPGLGLQGQSYGDVATELSLKTGGFSSFTESSLNARRMETEPEDLHVKLFYRLKCLDSNLSEALKLAGRLITAADFTDHKRLADLFLEARNEGRQSLVPAGSSFAAMRAERSLSPSAALNEIWHGVSQQQFLEQLGVDPEGKNPTPSLAAQSIAAAFQAIRERVVRVQGLSINLSAAAETLESNLEIVSAWAQTLPSLELTQEIETDPEAMEDRNILPDTPPLVEALTLPSKVAFVATSFAGSLIGEPEYSHQNLLAHLLRTSFLWEQVRMKGGAYGANASGDGLNGSFTFSTYRDPHITRSLDIWVQALDHFAKAELEESELLLAKIGCVAKEIRPMAPSEASLVAFRRWMYGITDGLRQENRDKLLAARPADLARVAKMLREGLERSFSVVIAGPEMVDKEESAHANFRPVRKQLAV